MRTIGIADDSSPRSRRGDALRSDLTGRVAAKEIPRLVRPYGGRKTLVLWKKSYGDLAGRPRIPATQRQE